MDDDALLQLCCDAADAVPPALAGIDDLTPAGERPGQYAFDLVADAAVLEALAGSGLAVLSEESGLHGAGAAMVAVVDPVDGSTNASRGIPWYATSICVVDDVGPRVAVVDNLGQGVRYHAVRGAGAWRDGTPIAPSGCTRLASAVVGLSGFPRRHLGWAQFRALGAAALDLCAVAEGVLDAYCVGERAHLAPWDYLGAMLVCSEAGAVVGDLEGEDLVVATPETRRMVAAAATPALYGELAAAAGAARDAGARDAGARGAGARGARP
ncbi:MAG TPA: inositol monophosphatase family protein [Acidimicrobiales bacterium]|nr:inositol monophosphatase family protein [Acidimicrobiales bacterium]